MGRRKTPICLVLMVILLWQCMIRKQWTTHSNLWFRNVFALWIHSNEGANHYLDYLNIIDASGKTRFTMETEIENGLVFLDLRLKLKGCNKITVDLYLKPTNSLTYVDHKACYSSRNINKIHEGTALRLRRICDSDEKCEKRSNEC